MTHGSLTNIKQAGFVPLTKGASQMISKYVFTFGFCFVLLGYFKMQKYGQPKVSESDIQDLSEQINRLNNEMAEVKDLLIEMMSMLKESTQ
mmetsp:Transcript_20753/g.60369  ORF Transcript_20753/g.60369 Transcript_20753/m.60369 type:complete len:91 (+) Transcript_20753:274-546(+)